MYMIIIFLFMNTYFGNQFFFTKKNKKITDEETEEQHDDILCKFVKDGSGRIIGESLSIDNDVLIIKSKDRFLGVPLKHIHSLENTLLVKGLIDLDKAYELGETWLKNSFYNKEPEQSKDKENTGI
ncbi:MAG: DUF5749 family beta-barrel protein [Thermoplasmatota archaeon]